MPRKEEPKPRCVIFLDVDGVLATVSMKNGIDYGLARWPGEQIVPRAVEQLKRIVDETNAVIVVSSTWRLLHLEYLTTILEHHGIPRNRIVGRTGNVGVSREDEILEFIHRSKIKNGRDFRKYRIVVLDDEHMWLLRPYHVKTLDGRFRKPKHLLTEEKADRAIAILNGPSPWNFNNY